MGRFDTLMKDVSMMYECREINGTVYIRTGTFLEGEGVNFIFYPDGTHFCRIQTDENFSDYYKYFIGGESYTDEVAPLLSRFGVKLDREGGVLYIRFRRNEISVAEAICKLHAAMLMLSSFGRHIFFDTEYH